MSTPFRLDRIALHFMDGPYLEHGEPTAEARAFVESIAKQFPALKKFAAKKLLKLFNEAWRQESEEPMKAADFAAKLSVDKIAVYDEIGSASVFFDAGGMFGEQMIEVSLDEGKAFHAGIAE